MVKYFLAFMLFTNCCFAQLEWDSVFGNNTKKEVQENLLNNKGIQIESTSAINSMYNYQFYEAEKEFKWLIVKFPNHPIGYFLLGLNEWWQIVANPNDKSHDQEIFSYMDQAIEKAEDLLDQNKNNKEADFFLALAYAFKGRVYAERENWIKSAYNGKLSLKYQEKSKGKDILNPELLIGDGLYNYYSIWIRENYSSLKPLLVFFKKGNKKLGVQQLEDISQNAFYTRMEARYFLVQIYSMENENKKAYNLAYQMHNLYPNNAFFHRYLARSAFALGNMNYAETYANQLLNAINNGSSGYGPNEGRYGAYINAYIADNYKNDKELAKKYYLQSIDFANQNDSQDAGYTLSAHLALGNMFSAERNKAKALYHYNKIIEVGDKKSSTYKQAVKGINDLKTKIK